MATSRFNGFEAAFRIRCGALQSECFALEPGTRVRIIARFGTVERAFSGQVTSPPELVEVEVLEPAPAEAYAQ